MLLLCHGALGLIRVYNPFPQACRFQRCTDLAGMRQSIVLKGLGTRQGQQAQVTRPGEEKRGPVIILEGYNS